MTSDCNPSRVKPLQNQHQKMPSYQLLLSQLVNLFVDGEDRIRWIHERILKEIFHVSDTFLNKFKQQENASDHHQEKLYNMLCKETSDTVECLIRSSLKIYLLQQGSEQVDFLFLEETSKLISAFSMDQQSSDKSKKRTMQLIPMYIISEYCNHFNHAKDIEQIFKFCMYGQARMSKSVTSDLESNNIIQCIRECCMLPICALELLKTIKAVFDSKKVSKIEDTETCGQMLLFVASVLPFNHQACINKSGHINTEHHALLEQQKEETPESGNSLDYYETFWNLQSHMIQFLSLKTSLTTFYHQARMAPRKDYPSWPAFVKEVDTILKCMEQRFISNQQTMKQMKLNKEKYQHSSMNEGGEEGEILFSPIKLLKNRKLFDLQLDDVRFRRQVLVQLLITISRLLEKNTEESYTSDLKSMKEKIANTMKKYDTNTMFFTAVVETLLLDRERHWCTWKEKTNCNSYFDNVTSVTPGSTRRMQTYNAMSTILDDDNFTEESVNSFLKSSDNTLRSYDFKNYTAVTVKEEQILDPAERLVNNSKVFVWKSCRLLLEEDIKNISQSISDLKRESSEEIYPHFLETICEPIEVEIIKKRKFDDYTDDQEDDDFKKQKLEELN